jgi:hypothetical protein
MYTPGMLFSFCVASLPLASVWDSSAIHQAPRVSCMQHSCCSTYSTINQIRYASSMWLVVTKPPHTGLLFAGRCNGPRAQHSQQIKIS